MKDEGPLITIQKDFYFLRVDLKIRGTVIAAKYVKHLLKDLLDGIKNCQVISMPQEGAAHLTCV